MRLNKLSPKIKSKKIKKRLGRGIGSGLGKTCGRGHKGQLSRAGKKLNRSFEGGQTSLIRRLPKFGFNTTNINKEKISISLCNLLKLKDYKNIDLKKLKKFKIISKKTKYVKIIMSKYIQKIDYPIELSGIHVSKKVRDLITFAGGKIKK